jgi:glycosyltransferase involved in cell wall biosynthesis
MKVAIFASQFYPHLGGVEELCRQLAHRLGAIGVPNIVVTNRWPRSLPSHEVFEGIPIYRVAMRVPEGSLKARVNYALTHGRLFAETEAILTAQGIDVIHVQCVSSNAHYALHASRALRLPLVVTLQGEFTMDASGLYERSERARALLRETLTEADAITGVSRKTLSDVETFYGRPFGEKGHVIYNGANLDDFQGGAEYVHDRPYLLAIGRMVPQKGFDVLLRAYAQSGITHLDLVLAGDGPILGDLQRQAQELKIGDRIHFPGRADRKMAPALFRGATFVVVPSRADEGLPLVVAETMAAGKAIIGTESGGIPEAVLNGQTGYVVPKEDVSALCEALQRLASNSETTRAMGLAGLERSRMFAWEEIARQYLELYEKVHSAAS